MKTIKKITSDLDDVLNIQRQNGNWNYDPYMHGLANGLIMARSLVTGEEPEFLDAPEKWLKDIKPPLWMRIKWKLFGNTTSQPTLGGNIKV